MQYTRTAPVRFKYFIGTDQLGVGHVLIFDSVWAELSGDVKQAVRDERVRLSVVSMVRPEGLPDADALDLPEALAPAPPITPPAPVVPAAVTQRQARLALLHAGHLQAVAGAIAAFPEPARTAASIEWEFAATVERNSTLVATLADAIGLSEADLDALFIAAGEL